MSVITGLDLTPAQVRDALTAYLSSYYSAMGKAIDEAGGSLLISLDGSDEWVPEFPSALRPSWAENVCMMDDGSEFYVDIDGPVQSGVFVTQTIVISISWQTGADGIDNFSVGEIKIEPARIRLFEDQSVDLGEARSVVAGLIAAGKLLAALVEREV